MMKVGLKRYMTPGLNIFNRIIHTAWSWNISRSDKQTENRLRLRD